MNNKSLENSWQIESLLLFENKDKNKQSTKRVVFYTKW